MRRQRGWHGRSYRPGDWLIICDVCGFIIYASESYHRWDGMIVCRQDFEERQPQDHVRGIADRQVVPFSRPEAADNFLTDNEVTAESL